MWKPLNEEVSSATNTVAIRNYALTELLKLANNVNKVWSLGLPEVTDDHVTRLAMLPKTNGFSAGITVLGRYAIAYSDGKFESFADLEHWMNAYEGKAEKFRQREKLPDRLTKREAEGIAIRALYSLGFNEDTLGLCSPPEVYQEEYVLKGQSVPRTFPLYHVEWRPRGDCHNRGTVAVKFQVSGITGRIVHFYNESATTPTEPLPTNYWQMLGFVENARP